MYQIYIAFSVGDYLCHDTKIGQRKVISRRVNYFHICFLATQYEDSSGKNHLEKVNDQTQIINKKIIKHKIN